MPSNLDPKLKEVYERVMGTPVNSPSTPTTPAPIASSPISSPPSPPPTTSSPVTEPTPAPSTQTFVAHNTVPIATKVSVSSSVVTPAKSKKKISMPILILGMVGFLVAYAFFWVKVFNLKLPFLP